MSPIDKPPVCLTIAGLDPSGGAGIIADIKTFAKFGCFPTAAVASLTFQNTTGVFGAVYESADTVRRQIQPILDDYDVAALKTGMLPTREIIETVADIIRARGLVNFVVDPVVRSTSGFDLIDDHALRSLVDQLFPLSTVITPNIPEAERVAQMSIRTEGDIFAAVKAMREMGARNVLIKGGHAFYGEPIRGVRSAKDYLFVDGELTILEAELIDTNATHGTGCTLAAAITANLPLGKPLEKSVRIAKDFVHNAIRTAPGLGQGHSPINI